MEVGQLRQVGEAVAKEGEGQGQQLSYADQAQCDFSNAGVEKRLKNNRRLRPTTNTTKIRRQNLYFPHPNPTSTG